MNNTNLKPRLRELAARSEKITEFALVRDANGRFVQVQDDDGGSSLGTAMKVGAGAVAAGGAGYGAYRGHKAIMGKFGTFGPMPAGQSRVANAYGDAAKAGMSATKQWARTSGKAGLRKGLAGLGGGLFKAARWLR
jgi:hypothetical protein